MSRNHRRKRLNLLIAACAACVVPASPGCSFFKPAVESKSAGIEKQGLHAVTSGGVAIKLGDGAEGFDPLKGCYRLASPLGGVVTLEVPIDIERGAATDLNIRFDAVRTTHGPPLDTGFEAFRAHPTAIERYPGWLIRFVDPALRPTHDADVLVPVDAPRGGLPTTITAGQSVRVLAELPIPRTARAGRYSSSLQIVDGDASLLDISIELTVLPLQLPATDVLFTADFDIAKLQPHERTTVASSAVDILREHNVAPIVNGLFPRVKRASGNRLSVDWSDYDRWMTPLLESSPDRPPVLTQFPLSVDRPCGDIDQAIHDTTRAEILTAYLKNTAEHFAQRGWLEHSQLIVPHDDTLNADTIVARHYCAGLARQADRRIRTVSTAHEVALPESIWRRFETTGIDKWIDAWRPPAQLCNPAIEGGPDEIRVRLDRPPFGGTLQRHGIDALARMTPWLAERYGLKRVQLDAAVDELLHWGGPFGLDEPLASMRLKRLRQGIQDVACLKLLEAQGYLNESALLARLILPYALSDAYRFGVADARPIGWPMQNDIYADVRNALLDVLADPGSRQLDRILTRLRRIELSVLGVRLRSPSTDGPMLIECWVAVDNVSGETLTGDLLFESLPAEWMAVQQINRIGPIEPFGRKTSVLTAEATQVVGQHGGKVRLPVLFRTDAGQAVTTDAAIALITSERRKQPIRIDGYPDDWPAGERNLAAQFTPVSAPDARNGSATRCLVRHDETHLYFGVFCSDADMAASASGISNSVRYEDLIPVGGDAFEILIDPTNSGAHAPDDLYHIFVTPSGCITERGVSIGDRPRRAWATDIRYAARNTSHGWFIELRLPLADFEEGAMRPRIWGLNFARFDGRRHIYETWSQAAYNAYVPLSLGNLLIP